jgi:predicted DNA-binding protein (UPF0251 family)
MSAALPLIELHASEQTAPKAPVTVPAPTPVSRPSTPNPALAFYRKYTEAMLRRYMRLSLRVGRMPALLGHDAFRGRMSTYRVHSFEDSVIFVYDVEKCLKKLDRFSQELIRRVCLQEYTQGEAAGLLHISLRTVVRRYGESIDALTRIFLEHKLLDIEPMEGRRSK